MRRGDKDLHVVLNDAGHGLEVDHVNVVEGKGDERSGVSSLHLRGDKELEELFAQAPPFLDANG